MIMMALLHMAGLENSECIWKIPAQTGSGCIRFNDWKVDQATFAEYSWEIFFRTTQLEY
jgi:hypothetical protein